MMSSVRASGLLKALLVGREGGCRGEQEVLTVEQLDDLVVLMGPS